MTNPNPASVGQFGTRQSVGPATNSGADDAQCGSLSLKLITPQSPILVRRISIGGPSQSICKVHVGGVVSSATFQDISYFGQQDAGGYPEGMYVDGADNMFLVWYSVATPFSLLAPGPITGSKPGIALATAWYDLILART